MMAAPSVYDDRNYLPYVLRHDESRGDETDRHIARLRNLAIDLQLLGVDENTPQGRQNSADIDTLWGLIRRLRPDP